MPRLHVFFTDADPDRPDQICDSNGSVILTQCKRCGLAESELDGVPKCVPSKACVLAQIDKVESQCTERERFEKAAYQLYLEQREAGLTTDTSDPCASPEGLFWQQPNGSYGVLMFNAAWWGWQAAQGLIK